MMRIIIIPASIIVIVCLILMPAPDRNRSTSPASGEDFLTPLLNFPSAGFTSIDPPDPGGAVGPEHYVLRINTLEGTEVRVFDKSGVLANTFALDTLGSSDCGTGFGDGFVSYDHLADRWLLGETATAANVFCLYMSIGADPSGAYYAFQVETPGYPDNAKIGLWADAYILTTEEPGNPPLYALNKAAMLAGGSPQAIRLTVPPLAELTSQMVTPVDLDGPSPLPGTSPIVMRQRDTEAHGPPGLPDEDILEMWAVNLNWSGPGESSLEKLPDVPVKDFDSTLCDLNASSCITQPTNPPLDPQHTGLSGRLQYRSWEGYVTLVGNFTIDSKELDRAGIRWFELWDTGSGWSVRQEATLAPDELNRWLGSAAMDGSGNIALAYNTSSSSLAPGIRFGGREFSDPLAYLPDFEGSFAAGNTPHLNQRWGDQSIISVDPVDGCTFWYTGPATVDGNWQVRTAALRFPGCDNSPPTDFALAPSAMNLENCLGSDAYLDLEIIGLNGFDNMIAVDISSDTLEVTPSSIQIQPGSSMPLTITAPAAGDHLLAVSGSTPVLPTLQHSITVELKTSAEPLPQPTLAIPVDGGQGISTSPVLSWQPVAGASGYRLEVSPDPEFAYGVIAFETETEAVDVGGIEPHSTYYWRVTAEGGCGDGVSETYSFQTGGGTLVCNQPPVTFENGIPEDWTVNNNAGPDGITWTLTSQGDCIFGNLTGGEGQAACADSDGAGSGAPPYDTTLVSNHFDLTLSRAVTLTAKAYYKDYDTGSNDTFSIDIFDGLMWENALTWDEDHQPELIVLGLPTDTIQLRVRYQGDGWDWFAQIDDIGLTCLPASENSCGAADSPGAVTIHQLVSGDTHLSWAGNAGAVYQVWWHEAPYFLPGEDGAHSVTILAAETGLTSWTDVEAPTEEWRTYFVTASCVEGTPAESQSNRVGRIVFPLYGDVP